MDLYILGRLWAITLFVVLLVVTKCYIMPKTVSGMLYVRGRILIRIVIRCEKNPKLKLKKQQQMKWREEQSGMFDSQAFVMLCFFLLAVMTASLCVLFGYTPNLSGFVFLAVADLVVAIILMDRIKNIPLTDEEMDTIYSSISKIRLPAEHNLKD